MCGLVDSYSLVKLICLNWHIIEYYIWKTFPNSLNYHYCYSVYTPNNLMWNHSPGKLWSLALFSPLFFNLRTWALSPLWNKCSSTTTGISTWKHRSQIWSEDWLYHDKGLFYWNKRQLWFSIAWLRLDIYYFCGSNFANHEYVIWNVTWSFTAVFPFS